MKTPRLLQAMFVGGSMLLALPALAAALPSAGSSAPTPLCGGAKSEKSEKTTKDEKKDNKADQDAKDAPKAPATT